MVPKDVAHGGRRLTIIESASVVLGIGSKYSHKGIGVQMCHMPDSLWYSW